MTAQRGTWLRQDDPRKRGRQGDRSVRRRGFAAALLPFAFLPSSTTAQTPPTLTLAEAKALPSAILATRLLGASAVLIRETAVRGNSLPLGLVLPNLASIDLASAPRSAGYPGLCEVVIITVGFSTPDPRADPPATVRSLDRRTRYQAVGSSDMPDRYGQELDAAQATRCATVAPVLHDDGLRATQFFGLRLHGTATDNPGIAYLAVRALTLSAQGKAPVVCHGDRCAFNPHPAAMISTGPDEVDVAPCPTTRGYCVTAHYNDGFQHHTTVTVETNAATPTTQGFAVRRATIEGTSFVE